MTPSLERLDRAIVHLDTLIGLYVAPLLRERLEACDDPNEQALIVGLVKAYHDVWAARCAAFGMMSEEALVYVDGALDGEVAAIVARERRWAASGEYQRGRSDEVAARMASEDYPGRAPRAVSSARDFEYINTDRRPIRRRERVTVEPHRALW